MTGCGCQYLWSHQQFLRLSEISQFTASDSFDGRRWHWLILSGTKNIPDPQDTSAFSLWGSLVTPDQPDLLPCGLWAVGPPSHSWSSYNYHHCLWSRVFYYKTRKWALESCWLIGSQLYLPIFLASFSSLETHQLLLRHWPGQSSQPSQGHVLFSLEF